MSALPGVARLLGKAFLSLVALSSIAGLLQAGVGPLESGAASGLLSKASAMTGLLALASLPLVFAATAFTRALPASAFLALMALVLWAAFAAPPLPLWLGIEHLPWAALAVQLIGCGVAWCALRKRSASRLPATFSWRRGSLILGAGLFLGPLFVLALLLANAATWIEIGTEGFVYVSRRGIEIEERSYQRGSQTIRLVGMMHLGDPDAYDALFASFAEPGTLVLQEGVSDSREILKTSLSYGPVANRLGLESQGTVESYFEDAWKTQDPESRWPHVRRADLDVADFSPSTQSFLESAGKLWASETLLAALQVYAAMATQEIDLNALLYDIITRRNEQVLGEIDEATAEYPLVVVPWGALHLPGIEVGLRERGFEQVDADSRALIRWSVVAP